MYTDHRNFGYHSLGFDSEGRRGWLASETWGSGLQVHPTMSGYLFIWL